MVTLLNRVTVFGGGVATAPATLEIVPGVESGVSREKEKGE
jgi:hypothetical protein